MHCSHLQSDLEAMGGLYFLHSHLNHSCDPNTAIRHLYPNNIERVTVVAKRVIMPGEEILVSYVDPEADVWTRRRNLKEWGFGTCGCERCVEEARYEKEKAVDDESGYGYVDSNVDGGYGTDGRELEDDLRGYLGV